MEALHVKIEEILKPGEKSKVQNGVLHLPEAGEFKVVIKEYDDRRAALGKQITEKFKARNQAKEQRNKEGDELTERRNNWNKLDAKQQRELAIDIEVYNSNEKLYKSNLAELDKQRAALEAQQKSLEEEYADVAWIYSIASQPTFTKDDVNLGITKGTTETILKFPKALEGGGTAYVEAFHTGVFPNGKKPLGKGDINPDDCHPQNKVPFGCFISAKGTPKVIAAEWKDKKGFNIDKKVAFGSTVYLHVYTEGLFGQKINVQLQDTNWKNADLSLAESDEDGQPIERLTAEGPDKFFTRKVKAHAYNGDTQPQLAPPSQAISSYILEGSNNPNAVKVTSYPNIQKCVFPVFVEYKWQYEGAEHNFASLVDDGSELSIHPIVYQIAIEDKKKNLSGCVLEVSLYHAKYDEKALTGNSPVLVEDGDMPKSKDDRKRIDFTFEIFIDGTLNNLYNSEARQAFEERTKVKATNQTIVEKNHEERYRYEKDSSYENDLSNPAIIYKNIKEDKTKNRYAIYTEGIGTLTKPNELGQLKPEDYKNDDTIGFALGTTGVLENTGIRKKVREAIEKMVQIITSKLRSDQTIGIMIVDVFGFSRGAAAARNFVHEITYPAYEPEFDPLGRPVDRHTYLLEKPIDMMPSNGTLGYLLSLADKTFDKLIIRFAGLYDTVPHHGLVQGNDTDDLGLNDINKANYVVHMVAADEHRANFSLVEIRSVTKTPPNSGKRGGIELHLPGVHCDVGGSYVEGRAENVDRIDASFDYQELKKLRLELINKGWFKEDELFIYGYIHSKDTIITDKNYHRAESKMVLNSTRKSLSNQYSFIPLHMMVEFCKMKGLVVDDTNISKMYKFRKNWIQNNVKFLQEIEKQLMLYAFANAPKYEIETAKIFMQPPPADNSIEANLDYNQRQIAEQGKLDEEAEKHNNQLKFLRNHYLHWNSAYGNDGIIDIATQPYHPNIEDGKRKRKVR